MGINKGWNNLPYQIITLEELLQKCEVDHLCLAVDWLGAFFPQLMDSANHTWLNVIERILIVDYIKRIKQ